MDLNFYYQQAMFWKKAPRRQECEVFTEDGRVNDEALPVYKRDAESEQTMEAWFLDSANQIKDNIAGLGYIQLLAENSLSPLTLFRQPERPPNKDLMVVWPDGRKETITFEEYRMKQIADAGTDEAIMVEQKKANRDRVGWVACFCVIVLGICILVLVIGQAYLSGSVHFFWQK
jgi:hypothetical protein